MSSCNRENQANWEKEVCSICLHEFELCVPLPCQHRYCALCIKEYKLKAGSGVKCPLCKADVPDDFFNKLGRDLSSIFQPTQTYSRWAYRSRSNPGEWWLYLESCSNAIEAEASKSGRTASFNIRLLGEDYTIDLKNGVQISFDGKRVRPIQKLTFTGSTVWTPAVGAVGMAGVRHCV